MERMFYKTPGRPRSDSPADSRGRRPAEVYLPPGWPRAVTPPGVPDWEQTSVAFLLDCCPPDFRQYPVLRRHPIVLARFAAQSVGAQVRVCAEGLSESRASLDGFVPPEAIEQAMQAWHEQEAALRRTRREVGLVEEALRGHVFRRKL